MKKRVVIKIGSQLLVDPDIDGHIVHDRIQQICSVVSSLQQSGHEVMLVASGAVAVGRNHDGFESPQAQAAYGQMKMTSAFQTASQSTDTPIELAQVLISREDIVNRERYLALQSTFNELLAQGCIPFVNENDTTAGGKNDFPDNDHLAAIIGITVSADHVFLLTSVDGVYTAHPDEEGAELIEVIENVNSELLSVTSGGKTAYGRGGMDGKLRAARLATSAGIQATIANGEQSEKIVAAVNDGATYGTACKARLHEGVQLSNRDRWVMAAMQSDGTIQIDPGATTAVQKRKSLLAVGVSRVYGTFEAGDAVEIVGADKETIAVGQTAIASSELHKLVSSDERPYDVEVVHADNLIMI